MKIGDLIQIKKDDSDPQNRNAGLILRFDVHHPDDSNSMIRIAEVLWARGAGWIDVDRIEEIKGRV